MRIDIKHYCYEMLYVDEGSGAIEIYTKMCVITYDTLTSKESFPNVHLGQRKKNILEPK